MAFTISILGLVITAPTTGTVMEWLVSAGCLAFGLASALKSHRVTSSFRLEGVSLRLICARGLGVLACDTCARALRAVLCMCGGNLANEEGSRRLGFAKQSHSVSARSVHVVNLTLLVCHDLGQVVKPVRVVL